MKISTIYFKDENLFKMIDDLAHRERKSISEITRLALLEYLKIHGSGNPVYPLTNWTDNPQFVAIPALLADHQFIKSWLSLQKDDKMIKLEYDVFSRLLEITGIDNNKSQKIKTNNIKIPSVEDCIKELLEFEKST